MDLRYGLDERPPWRELLLFGLQWLAIALPGILIIGRVVGVLQFPAYADQVLFLQKTCFIVALTLVCQIFWGHRLPLVAGPAAVLLVGVVASQGASLPVVYTSILIGGLLLAAVSASGMFRILQRLFTPRVVATVLLLIAFTLLPAILRLLTPAGPVAPLHSLLFALALLAALFTAYRYLSGLWRSTLIIWGVFAGTLAHALLFGATLEPAGLPAVDGFFRDFTFPLSVQPGVLLAFLFCYLALAVNDLGSIQSIAEMLRPAGMPTRVGRGITVSGLANALSGLFGVIGPVNFSLSPGVVAATGCASRFTLLPAAFILLMLAFSPAAIGAIGRIPDVVVGCILLYILCSQVAAGLLLLTREKSEFMFQHGLILALPLLLGTLVAFLPAAVLATFPALLQPILGNGFVVGVAAVLILEHVLFPVEK
ncbi:MAG: solute carrier family 23 protein [Desulfuromonadales bacterium]